MALEFVRDTDTTTVSKTDKYKPVQYIEPKKVIKAGAEGQPPTLGMATRAPLQFAPSGEKITPTAKGWLNENVARPAAGTVLGLDPLSQMSGGQYNIGGAVDPLAHFLSYYKSQLTGAPVQGPQAVSQGERALQAETPPWVQAGMEAYMGGHPYGLGHQFQGAQPMPRMAPEPPSRFKNATPEVVKAATTAEMDRLERTAPPPAQRQATPEQRQRLETIMTRQAESQALGRGAGREVTNPAREAQRLADTAARERNRAMREARKGGTYTRTKEAAAQEARTLLGPSPGTFEERAASAVADTLPPEQGMRVAAKLPKQERMGPELTVGRQPREARHHREFQRLFTERYPTAARGMPGPREHGVTYKDTPITRVQKGLSPKAKKALRQEEVKIYEKYNVLHEELTTRRKELMKAFTDAHTNLNVASESGSEFLERRALQELNKASRALDAVEIEIHNVDPNRMKEFEELHRRLLTPTAVGGKSLKDRSKPPEARHHREFQSLFTERFPTATRMMPGAPEAAARKPGARGPGDTGKGKLVSRAGAAAYPQAPKPRVLTEGPTLPSGAHEVKGPRGGKIGPRDPARALKGTWTPTDNPIKNAWHGVQSYLSPSTASEGARGAAQTMRAEIGEQKRHMAQQVQRLDGYRKAINALDPEAKRAIRDYLQGHEDVKPALALIKAPWMSFVKAVNETRKAMEKQIADLPDYQEMEFEENHLAQYWQESMRDQKKMAAKGHFVAKKYASYREGEVSKEQGGPGLHAKFEDPIQIVFQEMRDMANFLSKEHSLDALEKDNYAKRLGSKEREPVGTQLLQHVGKRRIYAAEDVARAWNNQWGPGVFENKDMGRLYMDTVRAMNASTAFTLGLSTKHAFNIAYGAIELNMQSAVKAAAAGRPITAAKHLAGAPAAPYSLFRKGSGLHDVFTGAAAPKDERMARVASLLAQSNMNITELEPIYRSSGHMSWVEAYKVGLLGKEFATDVKGAANLRKPITALGHTYNLVSKTMDSMMHPLFSYAIPRVKAGAFFMKMNDFLDSHPGATDWDKVQEAQRIADSIENVEGMMTQGNIMVAPLLKQSANLILQAPGWTFGALRAYGQGAADIVKGTAKLATGKKVDALSESAAYTIAAALTTAGVCAFAQAIMGAGLPTSPLDLVLPKTGGKNPDGSDERFAPFGNVKDLVGYYHDWKGELSNKVRGPWKAAYETLTNHDWAKHVIADPLDPWQKRVKDVVGNILKNIGDPISIQQWGTATPGSALPNAARAAGFTPAGQWAANPQRTQAFERRNEMKEHRQRLRFERRQENRKVPVTKPLTFARPGVEQTPRQPLRFEYRQ